jgi:hypothetical protein
MGLGPPGFGQQHIIYLFIQFVNRYDVNAGSGLICFRLRLLEAHYLVE